MKNPILQQALSVSMASLNGEPSEPTPLEQTDAEMQEELYEAAADSNELTPESYVEDRLEVEGDVETLTSAAAQIAEGQEVSHEQLDAAVALANAVTGRYGVVMQTTGMESSMDPAQRAAEVRQHLLNTSASLESALNVTMESYSLSDLWDKLGMMNREIPELEANIAAMKQHAGKDVETRHGSAAYFTGVVQAFIVDGKMTSPSVAAASTGKAMDELLAYGDQAMATAKKATDIAVKVDWKDADAAKKALEQIKGLKNVGAEVVRNFAARAVMGNRKFQASTFKVKGAEAMGDWANAAKLDVSWRKAHKGLIAELLFADQSGLIYFTYGALKKQQVKIDDLIEGASKVASAAAKTRDKRAQSPKKWAEHKKLVAELKAKVTGSSEAAVAVRLISEMDRLGWSCYNTGFTVMASIIRELNVAIKRAADKAAK